MKAPGLVAVALALAGTAIGAGALVARGTDRPGEAPAPATASRGVQRVPAPPAPAVLAPADPSPRKTSQSGPRRAADPVTGADTGTPSPSAAPVPAEPAPTLEARQPTRLPAATHEGAAAAVAGPPDGGGRVAAALPAAPEGLPRDGSPRPRTGTGNAVPKPPVGDLAEVMNGGVIVVGAMAAPATVPAPNPSPGGAGNGNQPPEDEPAPPPVDDDPPAQDDADDGGKDAAADRGTYRGPTRVTLQASAPAALPGQLVAVRVIVENAQNVGSIPFHVRFDPAVLRFEGSAQGPLLGSDGQAAVVMAAALSSGDVVVVGASRLGPVPGLNGSGELCTLTFRVVGAGSTNLTFEEATVRDPAGATLAASFVPLYIDVR